MTDQRSAPLLAAPSEGQELEPPWARYPWIPRGSIGWRMGSGEGYQIAWGDYVDEKIRSLDEALAYLRRHPKAPRSWGEWIAGWLAGFEDELRDEDDDDEDDDDDDGVDGDGVDDDDVDDDDVDDDGDDSDDDEAANRGEPGAAFDGDDADLADDDDEDDDLDFDEEDEEEEVLYWLAFVEAEGLTGDDVAYPVFVRNALAAGGMTAPWTWRGAVDTPDSAMRYSPRELGWWARWLAQECKTREEREAHLAAQATPPPAEWQPVVAAIRALWASGERPRGWADLTSGARALVPAMVIHGELPPPWVGDHPPIAEVEWEEDSDDRHRWAWWVFETFEDKASWFGYLARWPLPPRWRRALEEVSFPYLLS